MTTMKTSSSLNKMNEKDDTIVAISTPIGTSAISIVRLSGNKALEIAKILTKSSQFTPRYAYLKYLYNANGSVIDRGIVIFFNAPHSFSGEDIVEFQCHGGILTPKTLLAECVRYGARIANAGEFSKRALLNGKMDLATIESVSKLIISQNTQAQTLLGNILKGDLKRFCDEVRTNLVRILAHIEAMIDYAEENLPLDLEQNIKAQLHQTCDKLNELYTHSKSFQHIIDGHRLIIIGKPNVGKSSLLNRLLLSERAIVSNIAGTTRDIIQENLTIANQIITIIDTAGIHTTNEQIEQMGIAKSKEYIKNSTIIIAMFDGSRDYDDDEIIEILKENTDKIIIAVINKSDKIQHFDEKKLDKFEVLKISTLDDSVFKLRNLIGEKITNNAINNQNVLLSSTRQMECLKHCIDEITLARKNLAESEIFAYHINMAIHALSAITSPFINEEILDSMFGEFCLGK